MQLGTTVHSELVNAILAAFDSNETDRWLFLLRDRPGADGFSAVLDSKVARRLFGGIEGQSLDGWLLNIGSWMNTVFDPRSMGSIESGVLYALWDRFSSELANQLIRARVVGGIPADGGVFTFTGGLYKCIVTRYYFSGTTPKLEPVAVVDSPKSAFDFWNAIDQAGPSARNILKSVLMSGHKLISHRGVLTHVDRRFEPRVFGPSIDTLVMAEILAQELYERTSLTEIANERGPRVVLEVGCGSGLLAAGVVRHIQTLDEIFCVDIESSAITCTEKNLRIAALAPGSPRAKTHLLIEPFDVGVLNRRFDLVICNPPYIPLPAAHGHASPRTSNHLGAVGGLELLKGLVSQVNQLLSEKGKLLLMTSSLSGDEGLRGLPDGFDVVKPLGDDGFEVFFDVEAVLDSPEWLSWLEQSGGIYERQGAYFHKLQPVWIMRSLRD